MASAMVVAPTVFRLAAMKLRARDPSLDASDCGSALDAVAAMADAILNGSHASSAPAVFWSPMSLFRM